jgi:hypothetical protein
MDPDPAVDDLRSTSLEAIAGNLKPLLAALAPDVPAAQRAGVLAGAALVMLALRDHWPEITRAMEGPGPAPG